MGENITLERLAILIEQKHNEMLLFVEQKIDSLAISTAKGFQEVHKKIDKVETTVNAKFAEVDKRFDQIDQRFEQMDKRFDKLEFQKTDQEHRISRLEDKMEIVSTKLGLQS